MKTFRTGVLALVLLALTSSLARAQSVTLSQTTTSAAMTATDQAVTVAATTSMAVGDTFVLDREAMRVTAISGLRLSLARGQRGSAINAHQSGAIAYYGPANRFYTSVTALGTCNRANESAGSAFPHFVFPAGDQWECYTGANAWVLVNDPAAVTVTCRMLLIADMIDQSCFVADRNYVVTKITYVAKVAEAAGTLTIIPKRQQGTEAPASGDVLATAINAVTTGVAAETVFNAILTATKSLLILSTGERLGLDFTDDVAGELAGVTVAFTLVPR